MTIHYMVAALVSLVRTWVDNESDLIDNYVRFSSNILEIIAGITMYYDISTNSCSIHIKV